MSAEQSPVVVAEHISSRSATRPASSTRWSRSRSTLPAPAPRSRSASPGWRRMRLRAGRPAGEGIQGAVTRLALDVTERFWWSAVWIDTARRGAVRFGWARRVTGRMTGEQFYGFGERWS